MDSAKQYLWFSTTIFSNYVEVEHTAAADVAMSNAQHAADAHAGPLPFEHTTRALVIGNEGGGCAPNKHQS